MPGIAVKALHGVIADQLEERRAAGFHGREQGVLLSGGQRGEPLAELRLAGLGDGAQPLAVSAPVLLQRPAELAVDVVDGIGRRRAGILVGRDDAIRDGGDCDRLVYGKAAPQARPAAAGDRAGSRGRRSGLEELPALEETHSNARL